METALQVIDFFMKYLLVPVSFLVIFIVQLKIVAALRSQVTLIMHYGKQIEEVRKMVGGGALSRRTPEAPADEPGLYEVLRE